MLEEKLISQSMSVLPDLTKSFEVQFDACRHSLWVVLLQEGHAIAYESRSMNDHEKNLGIYEKELLAIMHALDTWKQYLLKTLFILHRDYQSLKYSLTQTKLSETNKCNGKKFCHNLPFILPILRVSITKWQIHCRKDQRLM